MGSSIAIVRFLCVWCGLKLYFCPPTQCVGVAFAMATSLSVWESDVLCLNDWGNHYGTFSRLYPSHSSFSLPNMNDSSRGSPSLRVSNETEVSKSRKIRIINRSHSPEGSTAWNNGAHKRRGGLSAIAVFLVNKNILRRWRKQCMHSACSKVQKFSL